MPPPMVDLALMSKRLQAVARDARLLIVGDKDQLASVEAGSVLGDICDRQVIIDGYIKYLTIKDPVLAMDAFSESMMPREVSGGFLPTGSRRMRRSMP
jgi:hypothetical protein